MGSKTRQSSYCTKRGDNAMNLVTSRKTNARLARPIMELRIRLRIHILRSRCLGTFSSGTCLKCRI